MSWKDEMHAAIGSYVSQKAGVDAVWAELINDTYWPGCETCDYGATRKVSVKYVDSAGKTRYTDINDTTMAEIMQAIT